MSNPLTKSLTKSAAIPTKQPALCPTESHEWAELPVVSAWLAVGFAWYVRRYFRRHFNAVRIAQQGVPHLATDAPVVCFANHPGWWDPLVANLLHQRYFSGRTAYSPIDQRALAQYPIFRRLGFYGIEMQSLEGAKRFLSVTRTLLESPRTAIWMTPSGRFDDVRVRTHFQPGLAHLASKVSGVILLPLAIEYTFWDERTPEALVEFGEPFVTATGLHPKHEWPAILEERLAETQARLAEKAMSRDESRFDVVLDGSAGVGGIYDGWRQVSSWVKRSKFNPRHRRSVVGNGHHV